MLALGGSLAQSTFLLV